MIFKNKRINLGCGNLPERNFINHDLAYHSAHVDVAWDLEVFPYPWQNNTFSYIKMKDVLEHLDCNKTLDALNELHRIIKEDCILDIRVPMYTAKNAYTDITHKRFFTENSFDYLDPSTNFGKKMFYYTPHKWKIEKIIKDPHDSMLAYLRSIK